MPHFRDVMRCAVPRSGDCLCLATSQTGQCAPFQTAVKKVSDPLWEGGY